MTEKLDLHDKDTQPEETESSESGSKGETKQQFEQALGISKQKVIGMKFPNVKRKRVVAKNSISSKVQKTVEDAGIPTITWDQDQHKVTHDRDEPNIRRSKRLSSRNPTDIPNYCELENPIKSLENHKKKKGVDVSDKKTITLDRLQASDGHSNSTSETVIKMKPVKSQKSSWGPKIKKRVSITST